MAVNWKPEGSPTVTPYLVCSDAKATIDFIKNVLGGTELFTLDGPDGSIGHAEYRVGDSPLMIGQGNDMHKAMPMMLYVYVEDVDSVYKKAVAFGAKSLQEPKDQFYGDRSGGVEDASGNQWYLGTHVEDVSEEEVQRRAAEYGKQAQGGEQA